MAAQSRIKVQADGHEVSLSNLDKVLYPRTGFTKGDALGYYRAIAPVLIPHVRDRPLTVRRFPDGVAGESFYMKHLPPRAPAWVRSVVLPKATSDGEAGSVEFAVICDLATLLWAANLAALELHVPQWKVDPAGRPLAPDLLVFDLDPGAPATIVECARTATLLAPHVESGLGWRLYPKTSGSKGLQLYAPVPAAERDRVDTHAIARGLAERLALEHPDLVVSNVRKELRSGRVLIDWSQNHRARTTVAPYSLRARELPTVSTPVTWEEVETVASGGGAERLSFLPGDVLRRVELHGDLFAPLLED